jgi:hypothetical protein
MSDKEKQIYIKSQVEFFVGKKKYKFVIYHNLPDSLHLGINAAVWHWVHATDDYSDGSLCKYIQSMGYNAMTQTQWVEYLTDKVVIKQNLDYL